MTNECPKLRPQFKALFLGLLVSSLMLVFSASVFGQATTGNIRGTVTDPNDQAIAGATVTAKNQGTGIDSVATTSDSGIYQISNLIPGLYTITAETAGFSKKAIKDVSVRIGTTIDVPVQLAVGAPTETVTVTSSGEDIISRDQSQVSTTIDSRRVQDLPSNGAGNGLDTLALLAPGVIANRSGGTNTNGTGLSVNGNRGRSNNFQIDGADNNDLSVGGPALFVDFQDSVQEFQIITNNFSAEYGRNQGAVVNIVGKSGTNDFHGTAFWHHQDAAVLNSLDNISRRNGIERNDPSLYNVFGGTIGGQFPLPRFGEGGPSVYSGKDRFFFFFGYQGIRNPSTFTSRSTSLGILPGEFARLQSTFPGNAVINTIVGFSPWAIPGAQLNNNVAGTGVQSKFNLAPPTGCPRALAVTASVPAGCGTYTTFINPSTGQPFLTGGPFDTINLGTTGAPQLFQTAQYQRTRPTGFNEDYYTLRLDLRVTEKDNITLRHIRQESAAQNALGSIASGFTGDIPANSKHYHASWTRTFSSLVNEFRANYQRIGVEFGGGCEPSTPGCIPGPDQIDVAFANISFSPALGLSKTNTLPTIGPATNLPQGRIGKVYQFADTVRWARGKNSWVFGAEYKYLDTLVPFLPNFNGTFAYNSATRIVNNAPSGVSITLGDPLLAFKEHDWYFFAQNDLKIRPNLTLNLGVRYEYTGQPINQLHDVTVARESNNATAFFNPSLPLDIRTVPEIPADKNNFAPRLGFAYTPRFWKGLFGDDATVIRGGFSLAYDPAFYNILLNVQNAAPFSVALTVPTSSLPATNSPAPLPNNPFGNVVRDAAAASGILPKGVLNPLFLGQTRVGSDFHSPFSRQFSFGFQRQFGRNHVAEARYVGTQGRDLFQNINGNFFIGPLVNGIPNWFGTGINMPSFANLLPPGTTAQVCTDVVGTLDREDACNQRQFRQGGITDRLNTATSDYHALQTRYNGRFLKNALSLQASYTWSKTIDTASEIFAQSDVLSPNAQNPFCIDTCERSLSALDRPHAFAMSFIYDVPFFTEQRGLVGHLAGGWQFNGTYILTSGATYTPGQTFNGNFGLGNTYLTAGDRPFLGNISADERQVAISQPDAAVLFGCPLTNINAFYSLNQINRNSQCVATTPNDVRFIFNGPGAARIFGTPFGDSPRNYLRGPIFNQLNLSVFKKIKLWENMKLELRAEAFNVLNHPNPGFGVAAGGYLPSINIGTAGNPTSAFAEHGDISLANRVVQVGFRFVF
ncbi:MAG TPA: carboxypeptidase regulatory-like domain-containing protein [Pyrinomonadaceae bacterium]|jgi:outer membrane receptor protein involved in Fe transport|nr:carboxypeptidase regulatory-like domain-containing protein [Pyrinomonadaceae bacterium]